MSDPTTQNTAVATPFGQANSAPVADQQRFDLPDQQPAGAPPPPSGRVVDNNNFEADFTGVQSQGVIPPGSYPMYVSNLERSTSQAGNPMLVWEFTIFGEQYTGRTFRIYAALTAAAMWKLQEVMEACGVQATGAVRWSRDDVLNTIVDGVINTTTYEEKERSNLDKVLAPQSGAGQKRQQSGVPSGV